MKNNKQLLIEIQTDKKTIQNTKGIHIKVRY